MGWKETTAVEERARFIEAVLSARWTMTELSKAFGVSRKTGYKWLRRYREEGAEGLLERSRAPHRRPNATPAEVVELVVKARRQHPRWGPRKLLAWLEPRHPEVEFPAPSTAGEILKRHGLVKPRRRRPRVVPYTQPFSGCVAPNDVWSADHKGSFLLGDGDRCYPLTIADAFSRFVLTCDAQESTNEGLARESFERAFDRYGLPDVIRTDNGTPFASPAPAGLSRLSVWWIRLGIKHERIAPGHPEQNGRHERMHRTLKYEATQPSSATMAEQQLAFDVFCREFNHQRPHEALGQKPPALFYVPSARAYAGQERDPEYPSDYEAVRLYGKGQTRIGGREVYVSLVLAEQVIGMRRLSDRTWLVRFADVDLGLLKEGEPNLRPIPGVPDSGASKRRRGGQPRG
jgi:transposase InsO family protein